MASPLGALRLPTCAPPALAVHRTQPGSTVPVARVAGSPPRHHQPLHPPHRQPPDTRTAAKAERSTAPALQLAAHHAIADVFSLCFGSVEGNGALLLGDVALHPAQGALEYTPLLHSETHPPLLPHRSAGPLSGGCHAGPACGEHPPCLSVWNAVKAQLPQWGLPQWGLPCWTCLR